MGGMQQLARTPSGRVFRVDRKRGPAWYAKYRLPDGRQVQRKVGPAWSETIEETHNSTLKFQGTTLKAQVSSNQPSGLRIRSDASP